MTGPNPRIRDVAELAGVSTATVSRALSKPDLVSKETLAAVLAAVRSSGYVVNHAARNLRRQRTGGIVALVPNLANPFFSRILAGIAAVLGPAGYSLLVADSQAPGGDARLIRSLNRSRADGLIVFDGAIPAEELRAPALPPVLLACEWIDGAAMPSIRVDNRTGAALAVAHLAALGHRAIGHICGPKGNVLTAARAEGACAALAERALPVREDWFLPGGFSLESGRSAAERWLALRERPTALFCANDEMACGFIAEVQRRGLVVPRDVSVVGFDDIELVAHVTPALTSVAQPRTEIGEQAARMILALIAGETEGPASLVMPVELIRRDSTASPSGGQAGLSGLIHA